MNSQILTTKNLQQNILNQVKTYAKNVKAHLVVILIGDDEASKLYVSKKQQQCEKCSIGFTLKHLKETVTQEELIELIKELNSNEKITGILVQLPLPKHIDKDKVISTIHHLKDVDGLTPLNTGYLATSQTEKSLLPATPLGVMRLLKWANISLIKKDVVVIGRSNLVGFPMSIMLSNAGATVTICHKESKNIKPFLKEADIIICAAGSPNLVCEKDIKKGSIIIDIGINQAPKESGKKIIGDSSPCVINKAKYITPVPGGVGPMTVATLLTNIIDSCMLQKGKHKINWNL